MIRYSFCAALVLSLLGLAAPSASAQSLGTFRWQLQPYGSVLNLNVTQQGAIYTLDGFESQCGGNASLPVSGIAVPQANGSVILGVTTINEQGHGLHTRATINLTDFSGTWSDNANNTNQTLRFNPGETCPGGPRTGPTVPITSTDDSSTFQTLLDRIAALSARLAALEGKQ
jgi:hypothetical protein